MTGVEIERGSDCAVYYRLNCQSKRFGYIGVVPIVKLRIFVKEIIFTGDQYTIRSLLKYALLIPFTTAVCMFLGHRLLYSRFSVALRQPIQNMLYFMLFISAIMKLFDYVADILQGCEIRFVKKLGFCTIELYLFLLLKCFFPFLIYVCAYAFVFSINEIDFITLVLCLVGGTASLSAIVMLLIGYFIYRAYLKVAKNILICVVLLYFFLYIWRVISLQSDMITIVSEFLTLAGSMTLLSILTHVVFLPSALQIALVGTMAISLACYGRKLFSTEFEQARRHLVGRGTHVIKGNAVTAFLRRDLSYTFKNMYFLAIQLLLLIPWVLILYYMGHSSITMDLIFTLISILLNSLFIHELFIKLDEGYANVYKSLPLKYSTFIFIRILTAILFSVAMPAINLLVQFFLRNILLQEFLAVLLLAVIVSAMSALYYISVIIPFYPKMKHRADTLLFISIFIQFILPVWPIIIIVGLRKGRKAWYLYTEGGDTGA